MQSWLPQNVSPLRINFKFDENADRTVAGGENVWWPDLKKKKKKGNGFALERRFRLPTLVNFNLTFESRVQSYLDRCLS